MGAVGLVAAGLLAIVFAWSAIAKARDRSQVATDFAAMGIPAAPVVLAGVIAAELAVAALLLVRPRIGALAAIVALIAFSAVLLSVIASGREIRCGCFGAGQGEPISRVDLVRNGALGVLAAIGLSADRAASIDLPSVMVVSLASLCLLVIVNLAVLARSSGGALLRIELAGEGAGKGEAS